MTTLFPMQMLSSVQKANIDAMRAVAASMLNAAERVTALNLDASRIAIEYAVKGPGLLPGAAWTGTNPRQPIDLQPVAEKAMAYFRSVQEISSEAQEEITKVLASRAGDTSGAMMAMLDNLEQSSPAAAAPAVAAVKSAIAKSYVAYGDLLKAGKQVAEANTAAVVKATSAIGAASSQAPRMKKAA